MCCYDYIINRNALRRHYYIHAKFVPKRHLFSKIVVISRNVLFSISVNMLSDNEGSSSFIGEATYLAKQQPIGADK
jgi:hypothetical protein